jgi:serine protease Do
MSTHRTAWLPVLIVAAFFAGRPRGQAEETAGPAPVSRAASAWNRPAGRDWSLRATPVVDVVRRVKEAVVNIHSERSAQGAHADDFLPITPSQGRVNGMGTGVVIDPRGFILTNHHVVEEVHSLRVRLADGSTAPARVLARDPEADLALLKIDVRRPLPTMPLGTSSDLMVGETVIAIGNAFGYEHTVTVGVVSAVARDVALNKEVSYKALIQTDASINPGNSGGPLLNIRGELVGLNVAIRAGAQGIGFAIPADTVVRVGAQLLAQVGSGGGIQRARALAYGSSNPPAPLGARSVTGLAVRDEVHPEDALRDQAAASREEGAASPFPSRRSLVVDGIDPDSPAQRAGVRVGDVLVGVGDVVCHCSVDLERAVVDGQGALRGSVRLPVRLRRDGVEQRVELSLDARPEVAADERSNSDRAGARMTARGSGPGDGDGSASAAEVVWRRLGVRLQGVGADAVARSHPQLRGGLVVAEVRPDSAADRAGIQRFDVLVGLHQWEMLSLDNVLFVLNHPDLATFQPMRFYILRGGQVHRGWLQGD